MALSSNIQPQMGGQSNIRPISPIYIPNDTVITQFGCDARQLIMQGIALVSCFKGTHEVQLTTPCMVGYRITKLGNDDRLVLLEIFDSLNDAARVRNNNNNNSFIWSSLLESVSFH